MEIFRQHSPWLAEKLGAAVASQGVKEAWEQVKKKLSSPAAQEAVEKAVSQPEKDRNWDMLKNYLLDALEHDATLREQLAGLVKSPPVRQEIRGDVNKQAVILGSSGSSIKQ